jgi:vancomycin aglycone glucosyltransferase
MGDSEMRVLLTTWGSRGDVEPLVGLAVAVRELGGEPVVCAPPDDDFVTLLARAGLPLVPLGPTVQSVVAAPKPPGAEAAFKLAPQLVAARFETLGAAAQGCDAIVATGLMPAGARDVADKLGIRYVLAAFHVLGLPSRHVPPGRRPGTPSPADETDLKTLWEQDAERVNALYGEAVNTHRAAIGLPPMMGLIADWWSITASFVVLGALLSLLCIPVVWINRDKDRLESNQKKPDAEVSNLREAAKLLGIS